MLIIIDKRLPDEAKVGLSEYGELFELETTGITYDTISGHPDIFFCKVDEQLVVAHNLPDQYISSLSEYGIKIITGKIFINEDYPDSASYNAVISDSLLIHRLDITDPVILENTRHREKIDVPQGYCRCSLLPLRDDKFVTSDEGIYKILKERGIEVLCVNPKGIILPGFPHGFFGGACGIHKDRVFIVGSLDQFSDGDLVRDYLRIYDYEIIELYKGRLFDGGSILFVE